jgi:hypothetical protein
MTTTVNDFGGGHSPREYDRATGSFVDQPPSAALARRRITGGRVAGMLAGGALLLFGYRLAGVYAARRRSWLRRMLPSRGASWFARF